MKLFTQSTVMLMLRRAAWMRWLPPMANRSPSPENTMTFRSGLVSWRPVAKGIALPWVVWKESTLR